MQVFAHSNAIMHKIIGWYEFMGILIFPDIQNAKIAKIIPTIHYYDQKTTAYRYRFCLCFRCRPRGPELCDGAAWS